MFERVAVGMVVVGIGCAGGGAPGGIPVKSPIPLAARGMFAGHATQVEPIDDHGRRCTARSRKFLAIEIAGDGAARWNGHHLRELACNGEPNTSRSCWTSGVANVTAPATRLALVTTKSEVATPPHFAKTLTRWTCGAGTVDLPSNLVLDETCMRVGPGNYQLETSADCTAAADDFTDLATATLELATNRVVRVPLTVIRKTAFPLAKVTLQPLPPVDRSRLSGPPINVAPGMLEGSRIVGQRTIVPDEDTKLEHRQDGQPKVIGSVKLCLDVTGAVDAVSILKSTGYPAYDRTIIANVFMWRYAPYQIDGKPAPVCTAATFIYPLQ